jgi:hypothetical protein
MTCVLSQIDDSQLLRLFGVRRFPTLLLCFLPSTFTRSSRSFTTYPLDLTVQILFGSSALRASGVSDSYALVSPGVLSPELHGFPPRVPLQWTVAIFFGLRDFGSLSHSSLGNLRSSFPRRLRSIDTYLLPTDGQDLLRVFTQSPQTYATVAPPPELLDLFRLRIFSKCSKASTFAPPTGLSLGLRLHA